MYQAKIKKITTLIIGMVFMSNVNAQQLPQYSHFMYNQMAYNPGFAGSSPDIIVNLIGRTQWLGFDQAPNTGNLNVSVPFDLIGRSHGAGLSVYLDEIGFNTFTIIDATYAYKIQVGDGNLGIGASVGLAQNSLNSPDWKLPANFESGTWTGPEDKTQDNIFKASAGVYYSTDELYLGLSADNIYATEFTYSSSQSGDLLAEEQFVPHYYLTAGYKFQLTNPAFELFPSVLISSDGQTSKYDINTSLVYNNKVWGGLSYRVGTAVTGMAGVELIKNLRVGLAYDFGTTDFNQYAPSTFEVLVRYNFSLKVEKLPERYKSIRYL